MAICPFAVVRLLPENETQPRIEPRVAILHSQGFDDDDGTLYDDFARAGNSLESTFFIRWDGTVEQYMDTEVRADANRYANPFAVSIETEDDGDPNRQPWSEPQQTAILRLLRWLNQVHPAIVLDRCDRWDGSGVGYHVMWGAPGPWTPVAKSCPGAARIRQFNDIIIPALRAGARPVIEEDDVPVRPIICDDGDPAQYAIIGGRRKKFGSLDEMRRHVQAGLLAPNPTKPSDPAPPVKWSRAELNAYPELVP